MAASSTLAPDGVYVVKVKSWSDAAAGFELGRVDVTMTASLCDSEGRVLRVGGRPAVYPPPHLHTVQGAASNVLESVEAAMRTCATNLLNAFIGTAAVHSIPGVGVVRKETAQ